MEDQMRLLEKKMETRLQEHSKKMDDQFALLVKLLQDNKKEQNMESKIHQEKMAIQPAVMQNTVEQQNYMPRNFGYTPRIEFPFFDGSNCRLWIQKCEKYFNLCKIANEQRVDIVALHLSGNAETWYNAYISARRSVMWGEFNVDICARFKDGMGSNVVEEFNKLSQTGSIEDYLDTFEQLKALMLQRNPLLPDQYFLDSFIGGLKRMLRHLNLQSCRRPLNMQGYRKNAWKPSKCLTKDQVFKVYSSGKTTIIPHSRQSHYSRGPLFSQYYYLLLKIKAFLTKA